jgi:hypothetical protein
MASPSHLTPSRHGMTMLTRGDIAVTAPERGVFSHRPSGMLCDHSIRHADAIDHSNFA